MQISRHFGNRPILLVTQVCEKLSASSLTQLQALLDWTELRIYDINVKGGNHDILLGTKGWAPD